MVKSVNIKILEKDEEHIKLIIEDVSNSFVNSLRRVLISEIPTIAIEEVWIVENNTVLYDKILAHRLGLIPLKTDLESFNLPAECGCGGAGCPQCRVSFTLTKEAVNEDVMVYSGDLESADPKVVPVSDKIPIVKLMKGQKVVLEAYGILGIGKDHAKWQASNTSSYKYYPNVEIDYDKCTNCEDCIEICPRKVFGKKDKKVIVERNIECSLCRECIKACEDDAINLNWFENKFIFNVETSGSMPAEELIFQALKVLNKKAEGFLNELKNVLTNGSEDKNND
ncbi:MAG: DNA-directed RNA polymerase subunit D [Candidatus Lokiarchaeota archaeon]|nr:DNA-directed RNA polymerase subunit D [Candidatus Lokiarchaeota archaeon]